MGRTEKEPVNYWPGEGRPKTYLNEHGDRERCNAALEVQVRYFRSAMNSLDEAGNYSFLANRRTTI